MSELTPFRVEVRDIPPPSDDSMPSASRGLRQTGDSLAERQAKLNVDIKNGKAIFRQKPMSFEKMTETMQGAHSSCGIGLHAHTTRFRDGEFQGMARVTRTASGTCIGPNTSELLAAYRQVHPREVCPILSLFDSKANASPATKQS